MFISENKCIGTFFFLLSNLLEVLIDDGDGQQDTSSRSNGSHEVGEDGEGSNTDSTEGGGGWDVSVEVLDHGLLSHSLDDEFLVDELLHNILGGRAGNVDPNSGEEGARSHNEYGIDDGVDWVSHDVMHRLWWGDVIGKSSNWCLMSSHVIILPFSKESNNEVALELSSQDLGEEIDIAHKGGLKDDWNVGGVEKLDWVWLSETSHLLATE